MKQKGGKRPIASNYIRMVLDVAVVVVDDGL
jgi:hypothetical protein